MAGHDELTIDDLSLSDPGEEFDGASYDDTSFLASPVPRERASKASNPRFHAQARNTDSKATTPPPFQHHQRPSTSESQGAEPGSREASLRAELATLRALNGHLGRILTSLGTAQSHLDTVSETVGQGGVLLDTWTRLLAGTEHNSRLLLDPNWTGASTDAAAIAAEEREREEEEERRRRKEAEEQRRKAELQELERARREATQAGRIGAGRGVGSSTTTRTRAGTAAGSRAGARGSTYGAASRSGTSGAGTGMPPRGTVTGVRGTRGGVRGGSATASGRGIARSGSVSAGRTTGTGTSGVGRGKTRGT